MMPRRGVPGEPVSSLGRRSTGEEYPRPTVSRSWRRFFASWFGTGLILGRLRGSDDGAGTVAGVVTLVAVLWWSPGSWWVTAGLAAIVTGASVWSTHGLHPDDGDPGWVVIDEAAGTLLSVIGLSTVPAIAGFVVFRIADIAKSWFPGVAAAERLPGGVGITADDLVAGLYGLTAGWAVQSLIG